MLTITTDNQSPTSPNMVSHCANPACGVPLRYLRDGRLFQFEVRCTGSRSLNQEEREDVKRNKRHVSHYWLCGACSILLTLQFDPTSGVVPVSIENRAAQAASAA
jgi:hypothetical protein